MKKLILLLSICVFTFDQAFAQFCNTGLSPNTTSSGQTLTTRITNLNYFNGMGSAPCNPNDVYIQSNQNGSIIYATGINYYNDSVTVDWNIPVNAVPGTYALYVTVDYYQFGACQGLPLMQCYDPNGFGIDVHSLSGKVFFDVNTNGIFDAGDIGVPNQQVRILPDSVTTTTNQNGDYNIFSTNGLHTVQVLPSTQFNVTSTNPQTVNISGTSVTADFWGSPTAASYTGYSSFWGRARCNTEQIYNYTFHSSSLYPVDVLVKIYHSPNTLFVSSIPSPDSTNGDTLYYNIPGVLWQSYHNIDIVFDIPSAGASVSYNVIAEMHDISTGNLVNTIVHPLLQTVSCSFDPNDKQAYPEGEQGPHYTLLSADLSFRIRFQNTGNDTAYNVHIVDTLDADLDLSTFEIVSSSHPVVVEIRPGGVVDFVFANIYLPDSFVNEPASNGYVTYRIQHLAGVPDPTEITNQAYIYFDFNIPVATNQTMNTLVTVIPVGVSQLPVSESPIVWPNPFTSQLQIYSKDGGEYDLQIYDLQGRTLYSNTNTQTMQLINLPEISTGAYIYSLTGGNGKVFKGILIRQ
jgi:hypothetical protein